MRDMLNRAAVSTDRGAARAPATRAISAAPAAPVSMALQAHQGRGNAALYLADRIARQAQRDVVSPDMENGDATVGDGSPEQEMEPVDPTIDERQMPDEEVEPADDEMPPEEEPDDEEQQARDEDGRFVAEEGVDVTIVNVDEEVEIKPDEDELRPEEMAA
jgi:hypothetical protein